MQYPRRVSLHEQNPRLGGLRGIYLAHLIVGLICVAPGFSLLAKAARSAGFLKNWDAPDKTVNNSVIV